jgi:hypothetical protein
MFHTALLFLIFMPFRVLDSIRSHGRSKRVMEVGGFDRSKSWGSQDVDILISSKKIK